VDGLNPSTVKNPLDIGDRPLRAFIAGGDWNNAGASGAFAVNGNDARSNLNWNIGFRSALPPRRILQTQGSAFSTEAIKGPVPSVRPIMGRGEKFSAVYAVVADRARSLQSTALGRRRNGKAQTFV
jgi:hypothetical protein